MLPTQKVIHCAQIEATDIRTYLASHVLLQTPHGLQRRRPPSAASTTLAATTAYSAGDGGYTGAQYFARTTGEAGRDVEECE